VSHFLPLASKLAHQRGDVQARRIKDSFRYRARAFFPFDLAKQNELYIKCILAFVAENPWLLMMQRVTHLVNKFGGQGLNQRSHSLRNCSKWSVEILKSVSMEPVFLALWLDISFHLLWMPRISLDLIQQPLFRRPRGVRGCHLANLGLQMQPVWRPKILTNTGLCSDFSASNGVRNPQASFYATCISRVVVGSPLFVFCKRQDLIGLDVAPPLPTPERRSWLLPGQSNKPAMVATVV